MDLQLERFSDINLKDPFFDSLRSSYPEFDEWYHKKEAAGATAYTYYINRELKDFLYLNPYILFLLQRQHGLAALNGAGLGGEKFKIVRVADDHGSVQVVPDRKSVV